MFERFSDRARRVVVLAQEEARLLRHNYIGTEHLLLGLARDDGASAATVLVALGISCDAVREQVRIAIGEGKSAPAGHIPFTPRAKKVLELALREALDMGEDFIGTDHLLLGVIGEGEGVGGRVLADLGVTLDAARAQVREVARSERRAPDDADRRETGGPSPRSLDWVVPYPVPRGPGFLIPVRMRLRHRLRRWGWWPWVPAGPDAHRTGRASSISSETLSALRRDKEAAVDAQDFETAAMLRDIEKQLLAARDAPPPGGPRPAARAGLLGRGRLVPPGPRWLHERLRRRGWRPWSPPER